MAASAASPLRSPPPEAATEVLETGMVEWRARVVHLIVFGSWSLVGLSCCIALVIVLWPEENRLTHDSPEPTRPETLTVTRAEEPDWKQLVRKPLQRPVRDPPPTPPPPPITEEQPAVVIAPPPPRQPVPAVVLGTMVEAGESRVLLLWNGSEILVARIGDRLPPPADRVVVVEITASGIQIDNQGQRQQIALPVVPGLP
jgi:hypothetical protein